MTIGRRYKFQGSKIAVQTGFAATKTITDISETNPAVVTSTAHGLVEGDVVKIAGVVGMTQVNGNLYVVDNVTANTFELAGVDATGYAPYVSGGTGAPVVFSELCEATNVNHQSGTADRTEVTSVCSVKKEFEIGLADSGTLSIDYNDAPLEVAQAYLRNSGTAGTAMAVKIAYPNFGGIRLLFGYVASTSFQGGSNGTWKGSASMQLTGEDFVLPAA